MNVVNEPILVDRNIIMSYYPETASGVAFELLKMLTSEDEMKRSYGILEKIRTSLLGDKKNVVNNKTFWCYAILNLNQILTKLMV